MRKTLALAVLGLAAVLSTPMAQAALSVADLATAGDGLLTVDSESGLAWLDVSLTRGMSLDDVANGEWIGQGFRMATSVEFGALMTHGFVPDAVDWLGGWAAAPEISTYVGGPTTVLTGVIGGDGPRMDGLVSSATVMLTRDTQILRGGATPVPDWLSRTPWIDSLGVGPIEGPVFSREDIEASRVWMPAGEPSGSWSDIERILAEARKNNQISMGTLLRRRTEWVDPQVASDEWGVFLVKEVSAVPEPSAWMLMGVGLVGLFALKGRRLPAA